jgi:hypothetical protein
MKNKLQHVGLVGACVVALTLLVGVPAAMADTFGSATVSIGSPSLLARVAVAVPIQYSCAPLDTFSFGSTIVSVTQAAGQKIATGTTQSAPPPDATSCDGATHSVTLTVLAIAPGPPFHGGRAVITVGISACGTLGGIFGCESAQILNQVTTIH